MNRRKFLAHSSSASALFWASPRFATAQDNFADDKDFPLAETTLAALQTAQQTGELTAQQITAKYLDRIANIDKTGPAVNAVLEINPDALAIAEALDAERKAKGPRGPLHGIPILLKDNIETADKMHTSAGSFALADQHAARDAFLVAKLRAAGAVILGKTNLSEWANFRSTKSSSGWSGRGGQTKNPYALDRNPCGSSSGSGVAVAANLCAVAVGTETNGSIVCPSSMNGVVGIKPTVGLISRTGIIPISHTQDTAGPMARTVADAAALLTVMAGVDERDAITLESKGKAADYTKFLDPNGLRGTRIGVPRKLLGHDAKVDHLINDAIEVMKKQGAVIIDPAELPSHGRYNAGEFEVLLYEFKADLNTYLAQLSPSAKVHSLKELIAFNEKYRYWEMPYFEQELFLAAQAKGPLTTPAYLKALESCRTLSRDEGIDAVMEQHKLDALVAATDGPAWLTNHEKGDQYGGGGCSSPAAVAGYPHITLPAGFVGGLPVGVSFFGRAYSEGTLIKLAFAYEQATKHRKPPRFLPTAGM